MYISYGSTDPSIVRYFSNRVPRSLATTSGQFVIDSATVAAWSLTSPSSSRAREGEVSRAGAGLREDLRGQRRVDGARFGCRAGSHEARDAREARGLGWKFWFG